MNDPDGFLASQRVAIVGLGLMGGSLALALRGRVAELLAVDPDPAARTLALERRVVDRITADMKDIILKTDVIILAAPVRVILEHIQLLGDQARASRKLDVPQQSVSTIVLDLGSTKQEIVEAMKALPNPFDPIGGHPICGKETSGLVHADAELFRGSTFAFTPLERTSPRARSFARALAAAVGAVPLWIDPVTHDHGVAFTSHLPYLLANALAGVTPLETKPLIGPGFCSTSRLAPASLPVMLDILQTNRQQVLEALHQYQNQVEVLEKYLAEGNFTELSSQLAAGARRHQSLMEP
jgi:prephenate dehydrogenase